MNKKETFEYCLNILKSYTTEEEFVILKKNFHEMYFVDNLFRYQKIPAKELEDFLYYPEMVICDYTRWTQTKDPYYWASLYNLLLSRRLQKTNPTQK